MSGQQTQRRLSAILAADVVGYSKLMAEDEVGTLAALREHRQTLFDPQTTKHGGRIVKLMGDGTLVEFPSVVDAVECALVIQKALSEDTGPIKLRIGINLGDVVIDGDDIYGDGVNIAARLEALAEPGGICIASIVHESIGNRVDASFTDAGEHEVKNIAKPVHVFQWTATASSISAPAKPALPLPDKPSIAVLPFDNLSDDKEQEYLVDGIVEDIITELSRFKELFVIARNSTFAYKGQAIDIRQVSRELGVRYIAEGSIRRGGNRIRIVVQLLDSETGSHVWAEKYDRDLGDIFELQEEITRQVVNGIAPQIEVAERARSHKLTGDNLSAYELSLKSAAKLYESFDAGNSDLLSEAIATATSSLELDPRNSHALFALGYAYLMKHLLRWGDNPADDLKRGEEIADRFVAIDQNSSRPFILRAMAHQFRNNYQAAIADFRQALELNPGSATTLATLAWGESLGGLTQEAREHAHLALRLSPNDTNFAHGDLYLTLTQAWFADAEFEEARRWALKSIRATPNAPIRRALMIASCGHLGDPATAQSHIEVIGTFAPHFLSAILSGDFRPYEKPEHNALVVDGLRKAGVTS